MDPKIRSALAELNRSFYAEFAGDFARTRQSWPSGFQGILPYLAPAFNVLDLGCGNGRLLLFLAGQGWRGRYLGLDSSKGLLALAAENARLYGEVAADFRPADLLDPAWPACVADFAPGAIASLAVLHHIPGAVERGRFLAAAGALLATDGVLIISTWQFLASARLRGHILPWSAAGLAAGDVEPGDYLLTWGQGAAGQRYCASIDQDELARLAVAAGLDVRATFRADGREGNLNLYAILQRARPRP